MARSRTDHPLTRPSVPALRRALDPGALALLAASVAAAEAARAALWIVGGPVRDLAAGLTVRDLDFATDRDPARLAAWVARALGGVHHAEPRFATASATVEGRRVDFAALRTERYVRPGALPAIRPSATLVEDLARRDFTVNALALPVSPRAGRLLVDPFGGLDDLRAGRLRVLHPASFRDDATRLWRAARFCARLRLAPDRPTARLIAEGTQWLPTISPRRLWREFALVGAEQRAGVAAGLLDRWGILAATHPALAPAPEVRAALRRLRGPVAPEVLLAVLLARGEPDQRAAVCVRLGAPRPAARAASEAAALLELGGTAPAPETLGLASRAGVEARRAALLLDPGLRPFLAALARWERTASPLSPAQVAALGIPPGPGLGVALAELRRARYVGTLDGAAAARRLVRTWVAEGLPSPRATSERNPR